MSFHQVKVKIWPPPSRLCTPAEQHKAPEQALGVPGTGRMAAMAQFQVQAEHSSAERRLREPRPSVGFLPSAFRSWETLSSESVVLCLMSAAQALAGLRLPKGRRPEIEQPLCASQVMEGMLDARTQPACVVWSVAQGLRMGVGG